MIASLGIQLGGSLLSGIGNMFSAQSQADAINKRISRAQELAAQNLVSQDEISARLHSIGRMFNQRLTSVLNTTAIRSRGVANRGVVGAAAAGQVEGSRLSAENQTIGEARNVNRQINSQIAQMELGKSSPDSLGSFVQGAASGFMATNQALQMFDRAPMPSADQNTSSLNPGAMGPRPMESAGSYNPFLTSNSPKLGGPIPTASPFNGQLPFNANVYGGY